MKHKHTLTGWWICRRFVPCEYVRTDRHEARRQALREQVRQERAQLYRMMDEGAEPEDDELLALFARNGSTDKGQVRRQRQGGAYVRREPRNTKDSEPWRA